MAEFWYNDAGTFRKMKEVWYNDAGTWRRAKEIWYNDAGTWRKIFTGLGTVTLLSKTIDRFIEAYASAGASADASITFNTDGTVSISGDVISGNTSTDEWVNNPRYAGIGGSFEMYVVQDSVSLNPGSGGSATALHPALNTWVPMSSNITVGVFAGASNPPSNVTSTADAVYTITIRQAGTTANLASATYTTSAYAYASDGPIP